MKYTDTKKHRKKFGVITQSRLAEAAMMTLKPGDVSDEEIANEHPRSEQWLFVITGSGTATVASLGQRSRTRKIRAGTLIVIERRERHQIRNTGKAPLKTLNIYVPPAYTAQGEVKATAKRQKPK